MVGVQVINEGSEFGMEVYELTQVKSYIEFPAETGQQKIPSVAEIQKGKCTFAFRLSGYSGHCKWHFLGNFSVQPISVSVMTVMVGL